MRLFPSPATREAPADPIVDPNVEHVHTHGVPQVNLVRAVQELAPEIIKNIDKQLTEMEARKNALLVERTQLQRLLEALQ
jgi:hypothetical protein